MAQKANNKSVEKHFYSQRCKNDLFPRKPAKCYLKAKQPFDHTWLYLLSFNDMGEVDSEAIQRRQDFLPVYGVETYK